MMAPSISNSCAVSRKIRAICLLSMPGIIRPLIREKHMDGAHSGSTNFDHTFLTNCVILANPIRPAHLPSSCQIRAKFVVPGAGEAYDAQPRALNPESGILVRG